MAVEGAMGGVLGVQCVKESSQDGNVDRVGATGRVIIFGKGFEEISE